MAKLAHMLKNAQRMDMIRVGNNESVPKRGKKKHYTHMSNEEKEFLFKQLKGVKNWDISYHALERIEKKGIKATYNDIISTIHNANIIEYHLTKFEDEKDARILLRSKSLVNKCYNLHVVFSVTRQKVVSVWLNHIDDQHKTVDMRDYNKNVRILGF
jgi:hypothetical protein